MNYKTLAYIGVRFLGVRFLKKRYPLAMAFELTHRCNMNCPHCYAKEEVSETGKEEHFRILEELHAAGCKIVSFTGGEPLLIDYLPELMIRAKEMNMWVQYTTNGVLLPAREQEMKDAQPDMIQLSLDGDGKTHEKLRGAGSFTQIMDALEVVKKNNWRCLIVSVMHKHTTIGSLAYVLSKAVDAGAFVSFQPLCDLPISAPSEEQLPELLDFLKEVRKAKNIQQFSEVLKKHEQEHVFNEVSVSGRKFYNPMDQSMALINYLYRFPDFGYLDCTAGKIFGRIRPDGQLVPCFEEIDRENPVNVITDGFDKAWRNLNLPGCRNCWHHHRLELNLIYNLSIPTLINVLYYHLNRRYYKIGDGT